MHLIEAEQEILISGCNRFQAVSLPGQPRMKPMTAKEEGSMSCRRLAASRDC